MMFDMALVNGRLVLADGIRRGTVAVQNGKIAALVMDAAKVDAHQIIDLNHLFVLPGLIDGNIHLRVPGQEHKEDFQTGSRAAMAGGVTTILDMPNNQPAITTLDLLEKKKELIQGTSYADYAFHFQGARNNLDELRQLTAVPSVKFFMAGHETTPTTVDNLGILLKAFQVLSAKGLVATVHAENQAMINAMLPAYQHRKDFKAYSELRNDAVCETAVNEIISLSRETGCKVHVCHVSTRKEIMAIRRAKEDGVHITCEVVPYHLFLTFNDCEALGARSKVSPALKSPADQAYLWDALYDGTIDCIASEHTPHTLTEKQKSVWEAPAGCPGVQEMLPLLLHKKVPLTLISTCGSSNPARIFGLKAKGAIQIGNDADLVVVDPDKRWRISKADLFSKCGWSSYEDWTLEGMPVMTFLRGKLVYERGTILDPPMGAYTPC